MSPEDRIYFPGNPWPQGHRISEFEWSARLEPATGIWFDFHLQSADYEAEDTAAEAAEEEAVDSDWESKLVWGNYHRCTISSTKWHTGGILVGTAQQPLDVARLLGSTLTADPLPLPPEADHEELAFLIYLLGHDSCANHRIHFLAQQSPTTYQLRWEGSIALTYAGQEDFVHEFRADIHAARFAGLTIPAGFTPAEVRRLLPQFCSDPAFFGY